MSHTKPGYSRVLVQVLTSCHSPLTALKTSPDPPNRFLFLSLCSETIHRTVNSAFIAQNYLRAQQVLSEGEVSNAQCLG